MALHRLIGSLRDATWLDGERARIYGTMLAIGLAALTLWVCLHPVAPALAGGDFLSFYTASNLALGGHAADVWRPDLHEAAEHAILPGTAGYLAFFYPPPFLLVCWPLALLPYAVSFVTWAIGTAALALAAIALFLRRAGGEGGLTSLALLALPALWINIMTGQNGALSLALFAGGFALLPRRPVLAGLVLGLLVIKPQLALALPFVLAAGGRWRTFFAAGLSAFACCAIAYVAVGADGFGAFLANGLNARAALEQGRVDPALLQSFFGTLRLLGAPLAIAYGGQAVLSLGVLAIACSIARRVQAPAGALGALTVAATLLATPFLLDYDLLIAALPLGWLLASAAQHGFAPWEKLGCGIVGLLPLFSRELALTAHLGIAPLILLALFAMVIRRILALRIGPNGRTTPPIVRYSRYGMIG